MRVRPARGEGSSGSPTCQDEICLQCEGREEGRGEARWGQKISGYIFVSAIKPFPPSDSLSTDRLGGQNVFLRHDLSVSVSGSSSLLPPPTCSWPSPSESRNLV